MSDIRRQLYQTAMNALARREYAVAELSQKLRQKFTVASTADIEQLIQQLLKEGLLSDLRFAEAFIYSRQQRGLGPVRIHHELTQRGVAEEIIQQLLDIYDPIWRDLAAKVKAKRFGSRMATDFTEKAKQIRFLNYRGFNSDQIQAVFTDSE